MPKLLQRLFVFIAIFAAFSASGHIAMYLEAWHNNLIASSAVFGASFISMLGTGAKIWYDILA